jgi:hypothetical protein
VPFTKRASSLGFWVEPDVAVLRDLATLLVHGLAKPPDRILKIVKRKSKGRRERARVRVRAKVGSERVGARVGVRVGWRVSCFGVWVSGFEFRVSGDGFLGPRPWVLR